MKFFRKSMSLAALSGALLAGCSSNDVPDSCTATPLSAQDIALIQNKIMEGATLAESATPEKIFKVIGDIHATVKDVYERNTESCEAQLVYALTNEVNQFTDESVVAMFDTYYKNLDFAKLDDFEKWAEESKQMAATLSDKQMELYENFQKGVKERILPAHDMSTALLHNVANNKDYKFSYIPGFPLEQPEFQAALASFYLLRTMLVSSSAMDYGSYDFKEFNFTLFDEKTDFTNLNKAQVDALNKMIEAFTDPKSKYLSVRKDFEKEVKNNRIYLDSAVTYVDHALEGYASNDKFSIGAETILAVRMFIPQIKSLLEGQILDLNSGMGLMMGGAELSKSLGFSKVNVTRIFELTDGYQKFLPRFEYNHEKPLDLDAYYFLDKSGNRTVKMMDLAEIDPMEWGKHVQLPDPTIDGVFPDATTPNPLVSLVAAPGLIGAGVIAAVAVPKYFGMIGKSKASEVPVNVASYKMVQEAYAVMENKLGTFDQIGFEIANSANFMYTDLGSGIMANSLVALDDCGVGSSWILQSSIDNSTGRLTWTGLVKNSSGDDAKCLALTPSFEKLADKME